LPTIDQVIESLKQKRLKYGGNAHTNQVVVMEEVRAKAIKNEPDADGKRCTRIGFETYSPECYSAWHETISYLMDRCGSNPILVLDLLLLLVHEAREQTETDGVDGLDVAKGMLFKMGDYEEKLRAAKAAYRARKKKDGK
jgi:hypothetical protein